MRATLSVPDLLVIGLAVAMLGVVAYGGVTSNTAYGPYTDSWEGGSEVYDAAGDADRSVTVLLDADRYDTLDAPRTLVIIAAPEQSYEPASTSAIADFLERGGTLVIADASGDHGNDLLTELNASVGIHGDPVRDELSHDGGPELPTARIVNNESSRWGDHELVLNHPSALTEGEATPIANTSSSAYLDHDQTGDLQADDTLGPHAVVATEDIGKGEIIVMSDPAIFTNVMLERGDNRGFAMALFAPYDTIAFDSSYRADIPPLIRTLIRIRESVLLQILIGGTALLGIKAARHDSVRGGLAKTRDQEPIASRSGSFIRETNVREYLAEEHPDWEQARIERLTESIHAGGRYSDDRD